MYDTIPNAVQNIALTDGTAGIKPVDKYTLIVSIENNTPANIAGIVITDHIMDLQY